MENYKKMLKQKISAAAAMVCIGNALFISLHNGFLSKYLPTGDFGDFLSGFQLGLFIALDIGLIIYIASNGAVFKDEKKFKEKYIKETDERSIRISELAGEKLLVPLVIPLMFAAVISGYFSSVVFFTLLAVVLFIVLMISARWMYFKKIM